MLIKCPGCNKEVRDIEEKCPNCGYPFSEKEKKKYLIGDKAEKFFLSVYRNGAISGIIFVITGISTLVISLTLIKNALEKQIPMIIIGIFTILVGIFMIIYTYYIWKKHNHNI